MKYNKREKVPAATQLCPRAKENQNMSRGKWHKQNKSNNQSLGHISQTNNNQTVHQKQEINKLVSGNLLPDAFQEAVLVDVLIVRRKAKGEKI